MKRAEHVDLVWLGPDSWSHDTAELELGPEMNQSELIEKVAQATELNQAVAGQAVKAVANAILDALVAGEEVRVSGLGIFKVAARPAREGRNPQTGEAQARPSKMPSIRRLGRELPGRSPHHERNPRCGGKRPLDEREGRDCGKCFGRPCCTDQQPSARWLSRSTASSPRTLTQRGLLMSQRAGFGKAFGHHDGPCLTIRLSG